MEWVDSNVVRLGCTSSFEGSLKCMWPAAQMMTLVAPPTTRAICASCCPCALGAWVLICAANHGHGIECLYMETPYQDAIHTTATESPALVYAYVLHLQDMNSFPRVSTGVLYTILRNDTVYRTKVTNTIGMELRDRISVCA